jgi:hypothetical protein
MRTFLCALLVALSSAIQLHAQPEPPAHGIAISLTNAELAAVLQLYSDCTGRTLLRHPLLSQQTKFNLSKDASSPEEARRLIEAVLLEKGIATIPDGEKFIMVVPEANASSVKPGAPQSDKEAKPPASQRDDHLIQPGMIALNGANKISCFSSMQSCWERNWTAPKGFRQQRCPTWSLKQ